MIQRFRSMIQEVRSFLKYVRKHRRRIRIACLLLPAAFIFTFCFSYLRTFSFGTMIIYWWAFRAQVKLFFFGSKASLYGYSVNYWTSKTGKLIPVMNKALCLFAWYGFLASLIVSVFLVILIVFLFKRSKQAREEEQFMAGSCLESRKIVIKTIEKKGAASPITLMDLPIIKGSETKHIMITGASGSGKTNAIKHLLNQILDQKVLVVDTKGELTLKYYNPARGDIIMNPLDLRYPGWNSSAESQYDPYYTELEQSLVSCSGDDALATKTPLSIKQWINDDSKAGWLFLSMMREHQKTLTPLFSYWLSLVTKSLKEEQPKKQRRLWIVIDALSDLPKIKDLAFCLSRITHRELCMVLCVQDFQQLETIYGHQTAKALVEFCATHVLFRCDKDALARNLSDQINTQTQARYGNKQGISARELTTFPDFVSCVQLPYGYPATKIKWERAT